MSAHPRLFLVLVFPSLSRFRTGASLTLPRSEKQVDWTFSFFHEVERLRFYIILSIFSYFLQALAYLFECLHILHQKQVLLLITIYLKRHKYSEFSGNTEIQKKIACVLTVFMPLAANLNERHAKKINKYLPLQTKLKERGGKKTVKVIPVIIGSREEIPKKLHQSLKELRLGGKNKICKNQYSWTHAA